MAAGRYEDVNYCLRCGSPLAQAERFGGLRPVCPACGWVYFADPKVAVAALIQQGERVLLVQRAIDPQRGMWTLPAGFVDAGENPAEAARRECLEETGLKTTITGLVDVLFGQEHSRGAHILIVYQADVVGGDLQPGDDVAAAAFFSPRDLPPLAFKTTRQILNHLGPEFSA